MSAVILKFHRPEPPKPAPVDPWTTWLELWAAQLEAYAALLRVMTGKR